MFVDSHCHLDLGPLAKDQGAVVERARAAGVTVMQSISTKLSTFPALRSMVEGIDGVFCSVGVHPHSAGDEPVEADDILALVDHPKVIGIGEAGLDYYYDRSPRDAQAAGFRAHIRAARASGLPLIVHTRDADADTIAILRDEMEQVPFTGEIHCFSTSRALGLAAVELGLYLGIGGILTFKRSELLRAAVAELPLDRLLLETDAPYLAPEPHRGRRNEPAYVPLVAEVLAEVKGVDVATIAEATTANFYRLYPKAEAA